jgi:hypothetical protein
MATPFLVLLLEHVWEVIAIAEQTNHKIVLKKIASQPYLFLKLSWFWFERKAP